MNDMRELLSGALPAPEDEPQQRDVIDAAMDWGMRRRRRDWALTGAAALAVVAVGTGVAAMGGGGSGNGASPGGSWNASTAGGPRSSASTAESSPSFPKGTWWTPYCNTPGTVKGDLAQYCHLYNEEQNFNTDFAKGSVQYIQAALPAGYTVKATDIGVLILTGPNGKTNYMFPSVEPASTLDGNPLRCGTPAPPTCVQTSTAGGTVVVNGGPSGDPSAGYVGSGLKDPRADILLGTSVTGAMRGLAAPTSAQPLLTNEQLAKLVGDPGFVAYAKDRLQYLKTITSQLQSMTPPSPSGSLVPITTPPSWPSGIVPSGVPSSSATDSWSPPTATSSSQSSPPDGGTSGFSQPPWSQSSGTSQPSGSRSPGGGISSSESAPGIPLSSGS